MTEFYILLAEEVAPSIINRPHEGEVLEAVVTAKRDKAAALKFLKRIMKKYGRPLSVVTDGFALILRR